MENEIIIFIASILLLLIIVKICSSLLPLLSLHSTSSKYSYMPYEKCSLLTNTEQRFYSILLNEARKRNLQVCPKVRLEDIICVTDTENKNKYRGYIKSRHVDFVLIDEFTYTFYDENGMDIIKQVTAFAEMQGVTPFLQRNPSPV